MKKGSSLTKILNSLSFLLSFQCVAGIAHHLKRLTSQMWSALVSLFPGFCGDSHSSWQHFLLSSVTSVPATVNAKKEKKRKITSRVPPFEILRFEEPVYYKCVTDQNGTATMLSHKPTPKRINHTLQLNGWEESWPISQPSANSVSMLSCTACTCRWCQTPEFIFSEQRLVQHWARGCCDTVLCTEHLRHQVAAQSIT